MPEQPDSGIDDGPEWLWHYTSRETCERILESKVLWATHYSFLNDWHEYHHAIDGCERLIAERLEANPPIEHRKLYGELLPHLRIWNREIPFVASFSADGDDLGQWRSYCPGGGVAVGMRRVDLATLRGLAPCAYTQSAVRELLGGFLDRMLARSERYGIYGSPGPGYATVYDWWRTAPLIKQENFSVEKEWRIVRLRHHDLKESDKHRQRNGVSVPYLELPLPGAVVDPVSGSWATNGVHVRLSPVLPAQRESMITSLQEMLISRTGTSQMTSVSAATFRYI